MEISLLNLVDIIHFEIIKRYGNNDKILNELQSISAKIKTNELANLTINLQNWPEKLVGYYSK